MSHRCIDVRHHILPPPSVAKLRSLGVDEAGGRQLPAPSLDAALGVMEEHFIETAIVSVSTLGAYPPPTRPQRSRGMSCSGATGRPRRPRVVPGFRARG
jgi:hypothetical protein